MPEPLKNVFFTAESLARLADAIARAYPAFDTARFDRLVHDQTWEGLALKARMAHVTRCLHEIFPKDYAQALEILRQAVPSVSGFEAMCFPDYVEQYGLDHWELSLPALRLFTRYGSAEFAIRPFIARDPERAMAAMRAWAEDENPAVRRLASEGCRPRLPWAMALPVFKKDPSPILPILEVLKDDVSEDVRRSVANNLNDISKDHPELVIEIGERWYGESEEVNRVVKHACRTMLKAGVPRAMRLFGFGDPAQIRIAGLSLDRETLSIGEELHYAFDLMVETPEPSKARMELKVTFVKARAKRSSKVFQIREGTYPPGVHPISRKFSFVDRSTRKHYPGRHQFTIVVNGVEKAEISFELEGGA